MADETQVQGQAAVAEAPKGPKQVELTISGLLEDLKNGISRAEMATKYGVTKAAIAEAFKHPKLKGHRVIREGARKKGTGKKFQIVLKDDTEVVTTSENGQEGSAPKAEASQSQEVAQPQAEQSANW